MVIIDRITKTEITMRDTFREIRIVKRRIKQAKDAQVRTVYAGRLNQLMARLKR